MATNNYKSSLTAAQIDSAVTKAHNLQSPPTDIDAATVRAVSGGEIDKLLQRKSNINLLDNWYFAHPVNQRGQTEYSGSGYTIDRWALLDAGNLATVTLTAGGITISNPAESAYPCWFTQYAETAQDGTQKTLSFLVTAKSGNDVAIYTSATIGAPIAGSGICSVSGAPADNILARIVVYPGATLTVKAAKLEPGDTQTLAYQDANGNWVLNDPPPNKALELAKCKWHYRLWTTEVGRTNALTEVGLMRLSVPTLGTVVIGGTTYYSASADL